jgi:hydroxymethylpyrimidine pyrophosphatase-like HAD family hydrolase
LARSGFNSTLVHECLAGLEMQLQPEEEQHVHKVSYWVQDHADLRQQVHTALAALPFETQVGFSHDSYLDVAPINGAKGGAVAHLLARWGLAPSSAVAAGDSGNDLSMLNREWHAIVVGNGHGELDMLRERSNVFFASRRHAGGILEGLLALGFLQR